MEALRNWANSSMMGVSHSGWSGASSSEEPKPSGVAVDEFDVVLRLESLPTVGPAPTEVAMDESSTSVQTIEGGVMKSQEPSD